MIPWSQAEIEYLTKGFLTDVPLKQLAWELKRSISALNKALTRFGIRERKTFYIRRFFDCANQPPYKGHPFCNIRRFDRRTRREREMLINTWISMHDVLGVMDQAGRRVIVDQPNKDPRETTYLVDGIAKTALQVVLIANKYRLSQNQQLFYVKDVTC